jgi:hypothetical protein
MPTLDFDWESDSEGEEEDNGENETDITYDAYKEPIDKSVSEQEYDRIRATFQPRPLMKPHHITQDFLNNRYPVNVDTQVFLSKDKQRILKDITINYYSYDSSTRAKYERNMELYMGKIMNEIKMQTVAATLQRECNVKVPVIYNYGRIVESKEKDNGLKENESKENANGNANVFSFNQRPPLKRADSMDADKQSFRLFIEMEYIADSQELTKLLYQSKAKCKEYKAKLLEIYQCLKAHHFSHGDMQTLDNILVNTKTGQFALIDYGQSSTSTSAQSFDHVGDINCDSVKGGKKMKRKTGKRKTGKRKKGTRKRKTRTIKRKAKKRRMTMKKYKRKKGQPNKVNKSKRKR